jgi:hypothetical protein
MVDYETRRFRLAAPTVSVRVAPLCRDAKYEPDRLAVRQHQGGELHEHAEARRGRWAKYRTAQEARCSIGSFIEDIYNRQRLHSALTYRGAGRL